MSKRGTRLNSSLLIPCECGTTSFVSVSRARARERAREFVFFFLLVAKMRAEADLNEKWEIGSDGFARARDAKRVVGDYECNV
jgi:hypothetical protein